MLCFMRRRLHRGCAKLTAASVLAAVALATVLPAPSLAAGPEDDPRATRTRDQSWGEVLAGPYQSPRIFSMPTAEVLGAWQLSAAWDASLLTRENGLSTTSLYAAGFGDFAQLEYRSEAVNTTSNPVPIELFAAGVQFLAPLPERTGWPSLAAALRLGFPIDDATTDGDRLLVYEERITDAYIVTSWQLWGALSPIELHVGARIGEARITNRELDEDLRELLVLPAGGIEVTMTPRSWLAAEFAAVPEFDPGSTTRPSVIRRRPFGRGGVRWAITGPIFLEASVGYRIETRRASADPSSLTDLVAWDMRTGLEIFLPWGAITCRATGAFCEAPTEPPSMHEGDTHAFQR